MTLNDVAYQYWSQPSREHFMALREAVMASANYSPNISPNEVASAAFTKGDYPTVIRQLRSLLPGALLSPGLHNLLATAYNELGDKENTLREATMAKTVMDGILMTGDGSREQPYYVLSIQDEYDVLGFLGKQSQRQTLVHDQDQNLDLHICEDQSWVWFEVSSLIVLEGK
ncbi:MAG: DUF4919 domain-containing protein [Chloroflexi bacterium]|nr:DUF4919 domain-containing protein [Chloroflexota bacterium]